MLQSLQKQFAVINALAYKKLNQRIRKNPTGVFGLIAEPLMLVAGFLALRLLLRSRVVEGIDTLIFLGSGCIMFFLFKRVALGTLAGVSSADRQVLRLRRVHPIDIVFANGWVEFQIFSSCMLMYVIGVSLYHWKVLAADPGAAIIVFVMAAGTAMGISITAFVIGYRIPYVKFAAKLVVRRVLFWTSGLFFSSAFLPDIARQFLLWNPLLHAIELFRHYLQPTYPIPGISVGYLAAWTFGSLGLGLLLYGNNEKILLETKGVEQ